MTDDTTRSAKAAAILAAAFATIALSAYGPRTAFSVLAGAALGIGNLLTMRSLIRALVGPAEREASDDPEKNASAGSGALWALLAIVKMVVLFGGIWILLTRKLVDPIPLTVGYGVMPLGIVAAALWPATEK